MRQPPEFIANCGLFPPHLDICQFRMCQNNHLVITGPCAKLYVNQWRIWLLMRQCPLKYKECPLKRPLSGRLVCSFEIQVAKATNGQKDGSAEKSRLGWTIAILLCLISFDCLTPTAESLESICSKRNYGSFLPKSHLHGKIL